MKIYNGDTLVLDIQVDDDSYRYRAVMGDDSLTLKFSLSQHVEIPVGSHCIFQNDTYTLMRPENLVMRHTRNFEYTVIMESYKAYLGMYKFRNTVDGRLKFSLTARPEEHLQILVDNMNQRDAGWTIGECIDSTEKLITYNHTYCVDAITQIAEMFNTEWEVSGKRISLKKVEYNKDNPLSLSYGKGNGFRPGIGRTNFDDTLPVEVLYVQGGSRNIDAGKYGGSELLLPKGVTMKYDGVHFEDEIGFNSANARIYKTDEDGFSIRRADKSLTNGAEDSQDFSEIYPHRDEKILKVIVVNEDENWYDVVTDAPESLDYSQYGIGGETPTIVFQDGELAGREFDLETDDDGNIICEKYYDSGKFTGWKFQIVPTTLDGVVMPGGSFVPVVGNIFRVFGIQLPEAYIEDNATKSGASWEMFREGVKYLYDHEDKRFTFTGELDGIWAKKDWINIGGKIKLGGFVSFSDARFQPEPVLIRITCIKDYVNNPYSPEIELSNSTVRGGVSSTLKKINNNQADAERLYSDAVNFTKRRFRDAKETISMLEAAMLQGFTDSISPLTVQTMSMLVGDESLQFRFVQSRENPQPVAHAETYNDETKILSIEGGTLQHMTLGITAISTSSGHAASEYRFWTLPAFDSPTLSESDKGYYVYAKVSRTEDTGVFYMSETARSMEADPDCYYLLMGILNSELDGARSYVSLYGFSEILPGRITTDVLRDPDGNLIIDLANALITAKNGARINANLTIGPDSSGLGNLSEWSDAEDSINNAQSTANSALQKAQEAQDYIDNTLPSEIAEINNRLDGVVENWFYEYTPTRQNEPAATWISEGEEADHVGDTFTNIQQYVDDATTPDAGKSWRWALIGGQYNWTPIADSDAVKALQDAAKAQDTADQKRRVFVTTPYTPYDVGDMWTAGPTGDIMRCIKARATGSYTASDWDKASKYTDDAVAQDALAKADAAAERLDEWADDGKISPTEKAAIKDEITRIDSDKNEITDGYSKCGLGTPESYNSAYNAYRTQLVALSAETPENITIPTTFRTNQTNYYSKRTEALNAISSMLSQNRTETTIDATSLDQDKYYPVTMEIDINKRTYINVSIGLGQSGKPSWATHNNGFTCKARWSAYGNGWGNTAVSRIVDVFQWDFTEDNISPIGNVEQMTYSSEEYIYVRGGGKYIFTIWGGGSPTTPVLRTSTYSGSGGQTLAAPIDSVTVPQTTEQKISDLDYLKNTFGYVVDVNGVVLGKLVAVKDDNGEVQAMMNGSTLGKDSTHGKLLIAGGISDIAHPETAKTRIYEDGTIDTEKLVARGGGKIGNFKITERIGITAYDSSSTSTTYSSSYFQLWDNGHGMIIGREEKKGTAINSINRTVKIIATPWGSADIGDGEGSFPSASDRLSTAMGISSIERGTGPGIVENIALLLESKGNAKAERNLAIKCLSGMFAGLRPKVRTISAATTLGPTDHTILVDSTSSFTITLPSSSEVGQEYLLLFGGSTYNQQTKVLACASPIIHCQLDDIWNAKSLNLTAQGAVFIVYANDVNGDGRWWVTRLA